jgi:hypothetical protein
LSFSLFPISFCEIFPILKSSMYQGICARWGRALTLYQELHILKLCTAGHYNKGLIQMPMSLYWCGLVRFLILCKKIWEILRFLFSFHFLNFLLLFFSFTWIMLWCHHALAIICVYVHYFFFVLFLDLFLCVHVHYQLRLHIIVHYQWQRID